MPIPHLLMAAALIAGKYDIELVNMEPVEKTVIIEIDGKTHARIERSVSGGKSRTVTVTARNGDHYSVSLKDGRNPKLGNGHFDQWRRKDSRVFIRQPIYAQDGLFDLVMLSRAGRFAGKNSPQDSMSFADMLPLLGALIVASRNGDGSYTWHQAVSLKEIQLEQRDPQTFAKTIFTSRSTMVELAPNLIFGKVSAKMTRDGFYAVNYEFSISRYDVLLNVSEALRDAPRVKLEALVDALSLHEDATLFYISHFDLIESGVFSVSEGQRVDAGMGMGMGMVYGASGYYAFSQLQEEFVQIRNLAINIAPALIANRDHILPHLRTLLKQSAPLSESRSEYDWAGPSELTHHSDEFTRALSRGQGGEEPARGSWATQK